MSAPKYQGVNTIKHWLASDSAKRVARTFAIAFVTILVPGLLGWLHAVTAWAQSSGQQPFPDGHTLAYLGVSAVGAGFIAAVNMIVNVVEDATGKTLLRPRKRDEVGAVNLDVSGLLGLALLALIVVVILVLLGVL